MIRSILSTCLVVVLVIALAATVAAERKWEFGLKGGIAFAAIRGANSDFKDNQTGFCAGGFLARNLGNLSMLQAEVLYVVKGGRDVLALDAAAETITISYLEIPLLAKLIIRRPVEKPSFFAGEKGIRPNFYAGPVVGFKLSEDDTRLDADFHAKNSDYGLAMGGGFDVDVNSGKIVADVRYTLGLNKIYADHPDADMRNGTFMMMVGYLF